MISKEDFVKRLKDSDWCDGTLEAGDMCAIWIAGIAVYAMCLDIQPLQVDFWYNVHFAVFDRVPPFETEWKLHWDHLNQNEFSMNGAPVIIIPLSVRVDFDLPDMDDIKKTDWDEFIGDNQRDDTPDET